MYNKIVQFVIIVVSSFLIPYTALQVIDHPHDYWKWFSVVIWVYLMISNTIEFFVLPIKKEEK